MTFKPALVPDDLPTHVLRERLRSAGIPFKANDSLAGHVTAQDLRAIEDEVCVHVQRMLDALLIDTADDHNTNGTARRVARMYLETFAGRFSEAPALTDFPNVRKLDELYTVGPITIRSTCAHHLAPITGQVWCGLIPDGRIPGLSKFTRLAQWIFARPQIQEEATVQLADAIEEATHARGVAVVVKANHSCVTWRGVKDANGTMVTSVMRGHLRDIPAARAEFMTLIGQALNR